MTHNDSQHRGFTLLEVVIYIVLFSLILTGTFVTAFALIGTSGNTAARVSTEEEGNFVMRKLSWALTGVSSITYPFEFATTTTVLVVNKYGNSGNPITIRWNTADKSIEMQQGAGSPYISLTSDHASVSGLQFVYIPAVGSSPKGVSASTTINGITFELSKYIRI